MLLVAVTESFVDTEADDAILPAPKTGHTGSHYPNKKRARLRALACLEPGIYLATTYSHKTYRLTTIGAAAFHFRVRNGTGWFHRALVTRG